MPPKQNMAIKNKIEYKKMKKKYSENKRPCTKKGKGVYKKYALNIK